MTTSLQANVGAVFLAGHFFMFGAGKFLNPAKWVDKFAMWGLPESLVSVAGALELAGAIGLLIPVLRGLAGLGLALFMVGAVATHIVHAETTMTFLAIVVLMGSAAVARCYLAETADYLRHRASCRP